jgi:hypothetical protein
MLMSGLKVHSMRHATVSFTKANPPWITLHGLEGAAMRPNLLAVAWPLWGVGQRIGGIRADAEPATTFVHMHLSSALAPGVSGLFGVADRHGRQMEYE